MGNVRLLARLINPGEVCSLGYSASSITYLQVICSIFCLSLLVSQPKEKPEETCSELMFTLLGEAQNRVSVKAILLQALLTIPSLSLHTAC